MSKPERARPNKAAGAGKFATGNPDGGGRGGSEARFSNAILISVAMVMGVSAVVLLRKGGRREVEFQASALPKTTATQPVSQTDPAAKAMEIPREERLARILNEGNRWLRQGRPDKAVEDYEQVLALSPGQEDAHFNMGIALVKLGRTNEALHHYEEALRSMPDYAEAHNNLGNLLRALGKTDEAIKHFKEAIRIQPGHAAAHNNLGIALGRQQQKSEAIEQFREAIRLQPDYLEAQFNLGMALGEAGQVREAVERLEEVLRLKPGFEPAVKALARLNEGPVLGPSPGP